MERKVRSGEVASAGVDDKDAGSDKSVADGRAGREPTKPVDHKSATGQGV